jgi:signal transduction histidine kinase
VGVRNSAKGKLARISSFRNCRWIGGAIRVFIVATVIGLFFAAVDFLHSHDIRAVIGKMIGAWSLMPLVPLVLFIDRRLPFSYNQFYLRAFTHMVLSVPIAVVRALACTIIEYPIVDPPWNPIHEPVNFYYYWLDASMCYFAIAGATLSFAYYRRFISGELEMGRLERRLLQMHLDNLRMQLEPHFLSNALNAISSEIEANPPLARQVISDLGVLLRVSHVYKDRPLIPLSEEISLLNHYLAIQAVRFGAGLKVEVRVAPEVIDTPVPCLLIQPLVENALRHGLVGARSGGTISLCADRVSENVEIRLADNGVGLPPGWRLEAAAGQGLTITRERLDALYPDGAARIAVQPAQNGGVEVLVSLPVGMGAAA